MDRGRDPRSDPGGRWTGPGSRTSRAARRRRCPAGSGSSSPLAGILMMRPRLYVVDEPLANLDPATAAAPAHGCSAALADEGHAVVIVEHRVEEALDLRPDRVLYLDEGATRYLGAVDGFLDVADPEAVKLPFEVVLQRVRARGRRLVRAHRARRRATLPAARPPGRRPRPAPRVPRRPRRLRRARSCAASTPPSAVARRSRSSARTAPARRRSSGPRCASWRRRAARSSSRAGRSRSGPSPQLATVFGYVFQSPSQMLFARTVREELLFGPRNLGRDPAEFDAHRRRRPPSDLARRPRGHPRAAAADAVVRPAEAARPRDRPGAPAARR